MKYLGDGLYDIDELTKKLGYANKQTFEQCLMSVGLVREIQDIAPKFVFHGGTATQFYLGEFQRASQDADIITTLKPHEIRKIIEEVEKDSDFKFSEKKIVAPVPLLAYNVSHESYASPGNFATVRLEITHSMEQDLYPYKLENATIFGQKVDDLITLNPGLLLPRKLLTFNFNNCGLAGKKLKNIGKLLCGLG